MITQTSEWWKVNAKHIMAFLITCKQFSVDCRQFSKPMANYTKHNFYLIIISFFFLYKLALCAHKYKLSSYSFFYSFMWYGVGPFWGLSNNFDRDRKAVVLIGELMGVGDIILD